MTTARPSSEIDGKGRTVRAPAEPGEASLGARQVLDRRPAEWIWSPERLDEGAAS